MRLCHYLLISIIFFSCSTKSVDESEITIEEVIAIDTFLNVEEVNDSLYGLEAVEELTSMEVLVSLSDTHTINIELPLFTVLIPKTYYDEVDINEVVSRENESLINIDLFQMNNASIIDAPFKIVSKIANFELTKVEQQYSSTLFFNEDGSGGVWTIEEVEIIQSNWKELINRGENNYRTFSNDTSLFEFPEMSKESIIAAEVYISSKEWPTEYRSDVSQNRLRFSWNEDNVEKQVIVSFRLIWGD